MTNPVKFTVGSIGFCDWFAGMKAEDAEIRGSFVLPQRFLKIGHADQLTREQLGAFLVDAFEKELGSFEAYLDEMRGSHLDLPVATRK